MYPTITSPAKVTSAGEDKEINEAMAKAATPCITTGAADAIALMTPDQIAPKCLEGRSQLQAALQDPVRAPIAAILYGKCAEAAARGLVPGW
jgi:hypothetical protein